MSSHSIHIQSNSALYDAPRASATVGLFDQAMVTAVVIAITYIAAIMFGWLGVTKIELAREIARRTPTRIVEIAAVAGELATPCASLREKDAQRVSALLLAEQERLIE